MLVNSCDKYEDAWAPFFALYKIMGAEKATDNAIILNTETKQFSCDYLPIRTINSGHNRTWSQRLIEVLQKINTEYVFCLLEDFFIQSPFYSEGFNQCLDYMRSHPEVGCIHTTPTGMNYGPTKDLFFERHFSNDQCNIAVVAVLWRKTFLMKLLRPHENIWQFEYYSGQRARKYYSEKVMQYNEIYPTIFDYHVVIAEGYGITEGKWLPKNKELFDRYGIKVDFERLGWYEPHEKVSEPITIKNVIPRGIKHIRTRISVWKSLR